MQETLQKLQALQGGALGQVSEEQKARRMKAATAAAEEITMSLEMKSFEPAPGPEEKRERKEDKKTSEKGSNTAMGVVIHWSGIRGFGILRSQTHGEVIVHAKALMNTGELAVGDVVTFELGFDEKKNKPEANSVYKSGAGGQKPSGDDARTSTSSSGPGTARASRTGDNNGTSKDDAAKSSAATAVTKVQKPSDTNESGGGKKDKRKSRSRRKSSSSSSSSSSRKRRRRSRSRSRSRGRRRR